mmetsp:Transcript_14058/g.26532  ORF Transcript_14058/g.26532 Transcript_14058/m.26532 type:complete len:225 (+) Transcript_14058:60-734(+)
MFIKCKNVTRKGIHDEGGAINSEIVVHVEHNDKPHEIEILTNAEWVAPWPHLNSFNTNTNERHDSARDANDTSTAQNEQIVVTEPEEVLEPWQHVVSLQQFDEEVMEHLSSSNSPTFCLHHELNKFAPLSFTRCRARQRGNINSANSDAATCGLHCTESVDNVIHLIARMEEPALYQETKGHAVDTHGVDVTANEETHHEVRPDDSHCASEPIPLIQTNVVEQR